jgi:preprotein translocase subunit SecA
MLKGLIGRVFGTRHERERKRVQPILEEIHAIEARMAGWADTEVQAQTVRFRERLAERTGALEARIAELKAAKHATADAAARERLEAELQGLDGRGGAEGELR